MVNRIKKIVKQLLCDHDRAELEFKYNFSDKNLISKHSSVWVCKKCGKTLFSDHYILKKCDETYARKLLKFYVK